MDPASAIAALSSSASSAGGVSSMSQANMVLRQPGVGGDATFELPQAPGAAAEGGAFQPAQVGQVGELAQTGGAEPTSYGHMIQQMVMQVNGYQQTAGAKVRDVLMGGPTTINDAMVSVQEAGVSFKLLAQVRNKLVDSYNEIMKMQV